MGVGRVFSSHQMHLGQALLFGEKGVVIDLRKQPLRSANVAVPIAGLVAGAVSGRGKGSLYSPEPAVQRAAGVGK